MLKPPGRENQRTALYLTKGGTGQFNIPTSVKYQELKIICGKWTTSKFN